MSILHVADVLPLSGLVAGTAALWRLPVVADRARIDEHPPPSVIVPARDEAANLPILLASIARQTLAPAEVIVVDDHSTDATASVAAACGATVLPSTAARDWSGKVGALATGVAAATGSILVFLDADVRLAPTALAAIVDLHDRYVPGGLLSVQPHHIAARPYEQLSLIPAVAAVMGAGMAWSACRHRTRLAFGPCLVTTPQALASVGGLVVVRHEVLEDAALARAYVDAGRPVRTMAGGGLVEFRPYPDGAAQLARAWTRQLAGGLRRAPALTALAAVLWVAGLATVAVGLRHPSPRIGALYAISAAQVAWSARRVGNFRWWVPLVFPFLVATFFGLWLASVVAAYVTRRVTWRGRRVTFERH